MFTTGYAYPHFTGPGYYSLAGSCVTTGFGASSNLDGFVTIAPQAGTFKNLYITVASNHLGTNLTFNIYKNGSATGISATLLSGATTGNDLINNFTVIAGDRISIGSTSATAGGSFASWTIQFDPS